MGDGGVAVGALGLFLLGAGVGRWFSARKQVAAAVAAATSVASANSDARQVVFIDGSGSMRGEALWERSEALEVEEARELPALGQSEYESWLKEAGMMRKADPCDG